MNMNKDINHFHKCKNWHFKCSKMLKKIRSLGTWAQGPRPIRMPNGCSRKQGTLWQNDWHVVPDLQRFQFLGSVVFPIAPVCKKSITGYCTPLTTDVCPKFRHHRRPHKALVHRVFVVKFVASLRKFHTTQCTMRR